MCKDWRAGKLGEFVELKRGYDLPQKQRISGEYPIVSSSGITDYHTIYKVSGPGVVTGRYGTIGEVYYITHDFWPLNTTLYVKDFKYNNPQFVYYFLKTIDYQLYNSKSAVPGINRNDLHMADVTFPSLKVQNKIVANLSLYDKLININNRRIAILEEIAQRIYREWFIRYRFPGHKKDEIVTTQAGSIPENWQIVNPKDIVAHTIGGGWGKDEPSPKLSPAYVIRGTDIPRCRINDISLCPKRFHTESNLRSRVLKDKDIIIEVSGGSKGQPVGRSMLVTDDLLDQFSTPVICASFCKLYRCGSDYSPYLFYFWLKEIYTTGEIEKYQSQSTGIINFKYDYFLKSAPLLKPTTEIQKNFEEHVKPIMAQIMKLGAITSNLRKTRDLLLPRLISGDLDVSDLDIKEVTEKANT